MVEKREGADREMIDLETEGLIFILFGVMILVCVYAIWFAGTEMSEELEDNKHTMGENP